MLSKVTKEIMKGCNNSWEKERAPLGRSGKASLGSLKAEEQEPSECPGRGEGGCED